MNSSLYFGDDKKYISAKKASQLTGYSQDYIGQLARANKIDARIIARVWFVSEESILNYQNSFNGSRLTAPPKTKENLIPPPKKVLSTAKKLSLFVFSFLIVVGAAYASNFNFSNLLRNISSVPKDFLSSALIKSFNNTGTENSKTNISDLTSAYKNYLSIVTTSNIPISSLSSAYKNYIASKNILSNTPAIAVVPQKTIFKIEIPKSPLSGGTVSDSAILAAMERLLSNSKIAAQLRGPQGPAGENSMSTSQIVSNSNNQPSSPAPIPSVFYPVGIAQPNPAQNFSGASYFSATNLSSNTFTTDTANITDLNVAGTSALNGSANIAGDTTIAGNSTIGGNLSVAGTVSLPNNSISNAMLANSTISGVSLGNNLNTLTFGAHLTSGDSSYNGSAGVTITSDATSDNTASTIVARDASGNFSAGTITADLTGSAAEANALNSATTVVNVSSATAPSLGQVLTATSGTAATWQTPPSGMVYPGAGIAVSTGSAWASSISGTSSQFVKGDGSLDSTVYVSGTPWTGMGYLTSAGASPGTYNNVTVAASGLVTSGSNVAYLTSLSGALLADGTVGLSADWNAGAHTITATTFSGALSGNASTATKSTNIAGGAGGSIPYQSAADTTQMLANGNAGQILRSAGTTLAPTWSTPTFPNTATLNHLMIGDGANWTDAAVPTWNQSTTGSAATLTTSHTIGGVSFNGSADITVASATGGFTVSGGALTISANNIVTDTTTGTKIGTATNQKLAFYNSAPIVQPTGDVATALSNLGLIATPTIAANTIASHTFWGQTYTGAADVSGSLTNVGNITGGTSSMTITAGTGNSRTLALQTTTSGGVATTALTLNADQSATFANTVNATTFSGALSGNASTATKSTNIAGGAGGSIPYQSAADTTQMLANGNAGQILRSAGTTLAPTWSTPTFPNTATLNHLMIGDGANWTDAAVPTWNQSTTGSAATLTTSHTIGGVSFNGSADITVASATGGFTVSGGALTISANNIVTDTTTGTKIGTATNQKLAFYNSAPIVQPTGDVATALSNLGLIATPTIAANTIASHTFWGQTYTGAADVSGSLTNVGNITGGTSSMTITAGTGNSRTLALQTTTSGGVATTALTLNADQSATFANTVNATTFSGALSGNASTATKSTNIAGGAGGSIPYQSAADTTQMLANGNAGQILRSAGTTLAPTWSTPTFPNTATLNHLMIGDGANWTDAAVPTWNQSTTGSAATLTTSHTIGGVSFNGSADITVASATGGFTVSGGALTISANNIVTDTTTGTKIGTATNQKLAFYNSAPIVQPTGDVATALSNLGLIATPTIAANTIASHTFWGQTYTGAADVSGSLTNVGNITGGTSSMTITAGTGNSRTLALQTTTSGGVATTALTLNADQSATFANTVNATTFSGALSGNASTATNLSGTPLLPTGTTAHTYSQADNSTDIATTAYVDTGLGTKAATGQTMYIGTTSQAINRASASEGLSGITSLTPGADFSLTQNSVNPFTSYNSGAIANTLVLNAGNVGIGTTAPNQTLEVVKTNSGAISYPLRITNLADTLSTSAQIEFNLANGDFVNAAMGAIRTNEVSAGDGALVFQTKGTGTLSEKVRITAQGNVGIGTTNPLALLSVNNPYTTLGTLYPVVTSQIAGGGGQIVGGMYSVPEGDQNGASGLAFQVFKQGVGLGEAVRISNQGNVGIGTTGPLQKLDVNGNIAIPASNKIYFDGPSDGNWLLGYEASPAGAQLNTSSAVVQTIYGGSPGHSNGYMIRNTLGTSLFEVQGADGKIYMSGNVGIGTTNPAEKLQVVGNIRVGQYFEQTNNVYLGPGTSNGISQTFEGSPGRYSTDVFSGAGGAGDIGIRFLDLGNELMRIQPNGNVGIGTTNPGSKLSVYDPYTAVGNLYPIITTQLSGGGIVGGMYTSAEGDGNGASGLAFQTYKQGVGLGERVRIDTNGNVGIGTTSPSAPLTVSSTSSNAMAVQDASANNVLAVDTGTASSNSGIDITAGSSQASDLLDIYSYSGAVMASFDKLANLSLNSQDLGNGVAGPTITLGRNSDATSGAGSIDFLSKTGAAGYVWQDATGLLRINTSAPTNALDTSGTVVGAQSSSLDSKNVIGEFTDYQSALQAISDAKIYNFTYKSGAYNNEQFTGIITDYSPIFGMDTDANHPNGKSLNVINGLGYSFSAIKELNLNLESVAGTVIPAPGSASESFMIAFFNNIKVIIGNWLADASNGLADIFVKQVDTKTLCVSDDSGAKTCITKSQLDSLLSSVNDATTPPSTPTQPPPTVGGGEGGGNIGVGTTDTQPSQDATAGDATTGNVGVGTTDANVGIGTTGTTDANSGNVGVGTTDTQPSQDATAGDATASN